MNKRDERGWRIPRKGTKTWEIYHFLLAGFKSKEIIELYKGGNEIRVMIHRIKKPQSQNRYQRQLYLEGRIKKPLNKPTSSSSYVNKLMRILGMSREEALAEERKVLENKIENQNRLQLQNSRWASA